MYFCTYWRYFQSAFLLEVISHCYKAFTTSYFLPLLSNCYMFKTLWTTLIFFCTCWSLFRPHNSTLVLLTVTSLWISLIESSANNWYFKLDLCMYVCLYICLSFCTFLSKPLSMKAACRKAIKAKQSFYTYAQVSSALKVDLIFFPRSKTQCSNRLQILRQLS